MRLGSRCEELKGTQFSQLLISSILKKHQNFSAVQMRNVYGCDCASSILLCSEDCSSILEVENKEEDGSDVRLAGNNHNCVFYENSLMGFPPQSDECLALLVSKEADHIPRGDYLRKLQTGDLDLYLRKDAIDWITRVHADYSLGPLSFCLAVNYLDRFISNVKIPAKAWMAHLISVACLSLAIKMDETEAPSNLNLQVGESRLVFDAETMQKMELLVLNTLNWRMQAVTPFSFIHYFLQKFTYCESLPRSLISKSAGVILKTLKRINFLEFRPSEVAPAVALFITGQYHPIDTNEALFSCVHIDKERVLRCYNAVINMELVETTNAVVLPSVPNSPTGVLDAARLSYSSNGGITESSPSDSPHSFHNAKGGKPTDIARKNFSEIWNSVVKVDYQSL